MQLYVYYKAAQEQAAELERRVAAMQASLGVAASLCRRPQAQDGLSTWMEVYPSADEAFEARLQRAVEQARLPELIVGSRHAEHFVEVASCA